MKAFTLLSALILSSLLQNAGRAELFLTSEVYPTIGMEGLSTYRISATSDLGNIIAFDFSDVASYGILGDLHQVSPLDEETIFKNSLSGDTHFLVPGTDVISLFTKESTNYLHGTMAFNADKQLSAGNSLPFVQVATPNASSVNLRGMFVVRRPNGELVQSPINMALPNIPIGLPPNVPLLPIIDPVPDPIPPQPPGPIVQPPIVSPPVTPPVVSPPVVSPPVVDLLPPIDYSTGAVARIGHGQFYLTAEVTPTLGREGFNTYRITASSDIGNVVGIDFTKGGSYGISGPLGQVNPSGQPTVFTDDNYQFNGTDTSQDSQFLVNSTKVISLFGEESNSALHAAFALMGDNQLTIGQSLPFVQVFTSAADQVTLNGAFAVRLPNGSFLETVVNLPLSQIAVGPAPTLPLLPIPEPIVTLPPPPPAIQPQPEQTPPSEPQYPTHPDLVRNGDGTIIVVRPVENPDAVANPNEDSDVRVSQDEFNVPDWYTRWNVRPWDGDEVLERPVYVDSTDEFVWSLQPIDWTFSTERYTVQVYTAGCDVGFCGQPIATDVWSWNLADAVPTAVGDALAIGTYTTFASIDHNNWIPRYSRLFSGTSALYGALAGDAAHAPEPSALLLVVIALSATGGTRQRWKPESGTQ